MVIIKNLAPVYKNPDGGFVIKFKKNWRGISHLVLRPNPAKKAVFTDDIMKKIQKNLPDLLLDVCIEDQEINFQTGGHYEGPRANKTS